VAAIGDMADVKQNGGQAATTRRRSRLRARVKKTAKSRVDDTPQPLVKCARCWQS
jgi:hypothetical protein